MTSAEIRRQFLDFFVAKHGHTFVPSSPVVPLDDPTLLFTNAGMNQFKPIFLGLETRPYTRAANTQKCIRAGGKHNDLDDVGRSRRHHTFFEMLGNWSFGDYFKRGAIEMAWELLTKVYKIDPTRLHASCYEGSDSEGIPRDTEAAELWKEIAGLPDDHIHYFGKDNFWMMGDTGPCGPCTEIYIDRTEGKTGGPQVNGADPRVMEIWNLVFIQYNREASGKLTPLPARHVDTGMGFERLCQVLQNKEDNYAIDLWTPLFQKISEISNLKYSGKFPPTNAPDPQLESRDEQLRHDIAFRVVADHARCLTFALTDGAVPSNEGRGYVMRRILRRAFRFGWQNLGIRGPFLHKLVPTICQMMGDTFPELNRNPEHVAALIHDEEISFGSTIDRAIGTWWWYAGQALRRRVDAEPEFNVLINQAKNRELFEPDDRLRPEGIVSLTRVNSDGSSKRIYNGRWDAITAEEIGLCCKIPPEISGEEAFRLYDTYGFPIDLTRIMAEEHGMTVDIDSYEKLMEQARELARAGGKVSNTALTTLPPEALAHLAANNVKPTDDSAKFLHEPISAHVLDIWDGYSHWPSIQPGSAQGYAIILDRTNFYGEMGGQVGDGGVLVTASGEFAIETTKSVGGYVLHIGHIRSGMLRVGDVVKASVSPTRTRTEKNHTATHLANWALREVLGDGVQQKGSLVDPDKLRFDFSHPHAMTLDQLNTVQDLVRASIETKPLDVYIEEVPQENALKINGLRAVFGEKYPPLVRVVSIGVPVSELLADPADARWREFSIEFCGGTHLTSTRQAGTFAIVSEESVSKGIRRLVALTGEPASAAWRESKSLDVLLEKAKSSPDAGLQPLIAEINQRLSAAALPLASKRRAQAAVGELQARFKAFEKASKSQPAANSNVDAIKLAADLLACAPAIGTGKLIIGEIPGASDDQLRSAIDSLKKKSPTHAVLLAAASEEKITFIAAVSDDLIVKGLKAGDWIKQVAAVAGGGGGGRPQMAQGSGKDPAKLAAALETARSVAAKFA